MSCLDFLCWLDTLLARDNRFLHDAAWLGSSVRLGRWTAALVARSVHGWPRVLSCTASCGRTASTKVSAGVRARCADARRAISLWLRDDPSCPSPTRRRKSLALAGFSCRPAWAEAQRGCWPPLRLLLLVLRARLRRAPTRYWSSRPPAAMRRRALRRGWPPPRLCRHDGPGRNCPHDLRTRLPGEPTPPARRPLRS